MRWVCDRGVTCDRGEREVCDRGVACVTEVKQQCDMCDRGETGM